MQTSSQAFIQANHTFEDGKGRSNLVAYKPIPHSRLSVFLKRTIDIVVSASLLLLLLPTLFPIVAIMVMLDSKGGVLFIQNRTGFQKRTFRCIKIRTMYALTESTELGITRFGMFLRKTHIDELPQLINVLRGEMSLVGPRPHMLSDTKDFESHVTNYHLRHALKPGITGLAQVNGFYGSVDDHDHLEKRIQHDIEYVYTWTILGDLKIVLQTLKVPFVQGV